jgi:hypothetical protein
MSYRNWAYVALGIGLSASITANVASTVLKETDVPLGLRVPFAVIWPVLTYLAIEILSRTPWAAGWKHWMVRAVLVAPVGLVAAFVSYLHQHDLMRLGGEPGLAQGFGPLAVDGLLFGAAFVLISTKEKETLQEYGVSQPIEPGIDWEKEFAEMEISPLPAPVSPAPRHSSLNPATEMAMREISARSPRTAWDVSRVAEMAVAGESFSVAKETGIGQSTYANITRVAKLLREDPRRDLSTAGKLPNGEVISLMRQKLVKA